MKETETKAKETIEIVKQAEAEKKLNFLGGFKLEKGHKVWELNTKTLEIQLAEIEKVPYVYKEKPKNEGMHVLLRLHQARIPHSVGKVVQKQDCKYCGALNMKNALKKFGIRGIKLVKKKKDAGNKG